MKPTDKPTLITPDRHNRTQQQRPKPETTEFVKKSTEKATAITTTVKKK